MRRQADDDLISCLTRLARAAERIADRLAPPDDASALDEAAAARALSAACDAAGACCSSSESPLEMACAIRLLHATVDRCGFAERLAAVAGGPLEEIAPVLELVKASANRDELLRLVGVSFGRPDGPAELRRMLARLPDLLGDVAPRTGRKPVRRRGRNADKAQVANPVAAERDPGELELPAEVGTARAAEILGVSKDTVLLYRQKGVLPFRDIAPPGSTKPIYMYPLDAVAKLRSDYRTDQPAPRRPSEPTRRRTKGERHYRHLDLD